MSALRERMLPKGWKRLNERNLPFTTNRNGSVAIIVSSGDEFTGNPEVDPCTNCNKGPVTVDAVHSNETQALLFPDMHFTAEELKSIEARETWILLVHSDIAKHEMRCELSRPINVNEDAKVDGWAERIILSATPFGGDVVEVSDEEIPQTPDISVNISRRA